MGLARGRGRKSGKETRVSGEKGMDRGGCMGMVVGKDGRGVSKVNRRRQQCAMRCDR